MTKHAHTRVLLSVLISIIMMPLAPGLSASAHDLPSSLDHPQRTGATAYLAPADRITVSSDHPDVRLAQALLTMGQSGIPLSGRGFAAAHLVIDSTAARQPVQVSSLASESANLLAAERILGELQPNAPPSLGRAIALALLASDHQAAAKEKSAPLGTEAHPELISMLDQLAHERGVSLSASDVSQVEALPPESQDALAGLLQAYVAMEKASDSLFQDWRAGAGLVETPMQGSLLSAAWPVPEPSTNLGVIEPAPLKRTVAEHPALDPAKVAMFVSARAEVLRQSLVVQAALARDASADAYLKLEVPPAIAIDLSGEDNLYTDDFAVIIDSGGNDVYKNNAGGNGMPGADPAIEPSSDRTAALLLDLGGNDTYGDALAPRSYGANGGGYLGSGLLIDASGDDQYIAGGIGINGGANSGVGMLVDASGDDSYTSADSINFFTGNGANGGAEVGFAALVDGSGRDSYDAPFFGSNGGGFLAGEGMLIDAGQEGDDYISCAGGVNGGGQGTGPSGFLLDAGGNDRYDTHACRGYGNAAAGNGAGENNGAGFLVDLSGDDTYNGSVDSNGAGAFSGVGLLIDASGNDRYDGGLRVNGGGFVTGIGMLIDVSGNDSYTPNILLNDPYGTGNGGAAYQGFGNLIDLGGDDRYVGGDAGTNGGVLDTDMRIPGSPIPTRIDPPAAGFLFDASGNDTYIAGSLGTNGGAVIGGTGFLFDAAGDDHYSAGDSGVNGGGLRGGAGVLIDEAGNDDYAARGGLATNGGSAGYARGACQQRSNCPLAGTVHSTALLLDEAGTDEYTEGDTRATDASVFPKGQSGQQIDMPFDTTQLHVPPTTPDAPEGASVVSIPNPRTLADARLDWRGPRDSGGLGVTHFIISRGASPESMSLLATVGDDVRTYLDKGVTPETTLYYAIQAQTDAGTGESALVRADIHFCATPRDEFGNTCKQTTYAWADTSGGTSLNIQRGEVSDALPLPFAFPWYGTTATSIYVASSGTLCFATSGCELDTSTVPAAPGQPGGYVACYRTELYPGLAGSSITYATFGTAPDRTFVVTYDHVPFSDWYFDERQTFQIQLRENGEADCMLADVVESNSAMVATLMPDGQSGLVYYQGYVGAHELGIGFSAAS